MERITLIFLFLGLMGHGQSISGGEYFFNADPGVGNGTPLSVNTNSGELTQTFSIPTNSLSEGFHSFYVRTQDNSGNWSLYDRQIIYLTTFASSNITNAEYFFNTDPGVGNGIPLSVNTNSGGLTQTFSIPTNSLSEGFHSFYVRMQNNSGIWSLYDRQIIYIKNFDFDPDEVSSAEYFIDSDPGIGNGTALTFGNPSQTSQVLNIDSSGLSNGDHIFYVRVQDSNGDWSIYDSAAFTIDASLGEDNNLLEFLKIYPNPIKDKLFINLSNHVHLDKIEIYNNMGQTVYKAYYPGENLNLSHLKAGVYILNIKTDTGSASLKIIKA